MIMLLLWQLVLPLGLIAGVAIALPRSQLGVWLQVLVTAIVLLAIARMGIWLFPPWWVPYAYGVLFTIAVGIGLRRHQRRKTLPSRWLGWAVVIGWVAFGVFAGHEAVQSWQGQYPPALPAVDLAFPLRGGDYLVVHGGNDIRINAHLKTLDESVPRFRAYRGNSYAVDIIQVDRLGMRAKGLAPPDPAAYNIYGEPVLAPCDGQIVAAVDGVRDQKIPEAYPVDRSGNHVILRCGEVDILLAHFRPQSLAVQTGETVTVGDRIAEVGNSGASNEPHLHIHAQRPGTAAAPLSGDPLPMRFAGRYLIRGDRVTVPTRVKGEG